MRPNSPEFLRITKEINTKENEIVDFTKEELIEDEYLYQENRDNW